MSITVGDNAPDVRLRDQNGKGVSLADFRGKKAVVLYFYDQPRAVDFALNRVGQWFDRTL